MWSYDWVSIPLVYTQVFVMQKLNLKNGLSFFLNKTLVGVSFFIKVVTLSTYSFVIACIFGRQYTDNGSTDISIDVYFPLWTVLQILFYMGLLKVRD